MWSWAIDYIPDASLDKWAWWMGVSAVVLPLIGGLCGWVALEISDKISQKKDAAEATRTARLEATERELATTKAELSQRVSKAEEAVKPKPLQVRIRNVLSSIDQKIIPALRSGTRNFEGGITASQFNALQTIAREPGAQKFIVVDPDVRMGVGMGPEGITYGVKFTVDPKVLDDETR